jgi:hypothetical protein
MLAYRQLRNVNMSSLILIVTVHPETNVLKLAAFGVELNACRMKADQEQVIATMVAQAIQIK